MKELDASEESPTSYDELMVQLFDAAEKEIEELEKKIQSLGSFNVIANTFFKNQLTINERYNDYKPGKLPMVSEYVALICLKFKFSQGIREITNVHEIAKDFFEISELANSILSKYGFLHSKRINEEVKNKASDSLRDISTSVAMEEYFVRNPAIEEHHWTVIEELYTPYDNILLEELGFSTLDGIDLCLAINEYIINAVKQSLASFSTTWQEQYWEIIRYKKHKIRPTNFYPDEKLLALSKKTDQELKNQFRAFAQTYEQITLGAKLSFTANDISQFSEIELKKVEAFLNVLSITFGEINIDFRVPDIIHPLKEKPLIKHEDRFICPSISLLDYAIDKIFDKVLLNTKQEKYKTFKHDYLVNKGIELIASVLPSSEYYTHLKYNDGNNGELDGLIIYDNCAFFIEGKSHRITDKAKKGNADRVKIHIKDIIEASYNQSIRASDYVLKNSSPSFLRKKGKKIIINNTVIKRCFLISLSFDPISNFSLFIKQSNDLNLFTDEKFPWIISLYDLMVVVEHIESPSFLIHFLQKRFDFFNVKKLHMHDELDLLAYYLKRSLSFNKLISETLDVDRVTFESYMDEINQYYFYKSGKTTFVKSKMVHHCSLKTKNLIKAIDQSNFLNRTDVSLCLLNLNSDSQKKINKYIEQLKKEFKRDRMPHDFSLAGNGQDERWGFTYFITQRSSDNIERFRKFCQYKLLTMSSNTWVGILDTNDKAYDFVEVSSLIN